MEDSNKKIWFRRKWFGWGWYPATKEGWAVTIGYVIIILALTFTLDENSSDREVVLMLMLPMVILTAALIRVCYTHGETPRWQWGKPKEKEK